MKIIKMILLFILISSSAFAQDAIKKYDQHLFGTWSDSEKDGQGVGMTKNWIMDRFEDGTFVLLFTTVHGEKITNFAEKGKWWIDKNGFFNKYYNVPNLTGLRV